MNNTITTQYTPAIVSASDFRMRAYSVPLYTPATVSVYVEDLGLVFIMNADDDKNTTTRMVNIHVINEDGTPGREVDCMTIYNDDKNAAAQLSEAVAGWVEDYEEE